MNFMQCTFIAHKLQGDLQNLQEEEQQKQMKLPKQFYVFFFVCQDVLFRKSWLNKIKSFIEVNQPRNSSLLENEQPLK